MTNVLILSRFGLKRLLNALNVNVKKLMFNSLWCMRLAPLPVRQTSSRPGPRWANHSRRSDKGRGLRQWLYGASPETTKMTADLWHLLLLFCLFEVLPVQTSSDQYYQFAQRQFGQHRLDNAPWNFKMNWEVTTNICICKSVQRCQASNKFYWHPYYNCVCVCIECTINQSIKQFII